MERPLNTQVDALAAGPNARRRLIRGAFAAPAIMTVCSGSALAGSSSLRCVAHQANTPVTVLSLPDSSTVGWMRVQLYTQGSGSTYYVKGSAIVALKAPGTSTAYMGLSDWQPFNINNSTAGTVNSASPSNPQLSSPAKYAAIRVDAGGNIVGVGATGGGTAIAGTCWTSFTLAP